MEGQPSGGWGAGPDPPSVLMFLHCEVPNKRKSVAPFLSTHDFFGQQFRPGQTGQGRGQAAWSPAHSAETEAQILTALKASGRTGGVRKIAKRFAVDPGTVQRISRPLESAEAALGDLTCSMGASRVYPRIYHVTSGTPPGGRQSPLGSGAT